MSTPNPYAQDSSNNPQPQGPGQYQQPAPGQYAQPEASAQGKSWTVALVLSILLGGWGVADFYLGYVKIGIAKLGLWILGLIFFVIGLSSSVVTAVDMAEAGADLEATGLSISPMMLVGNALWTVLGIWVLVTLIMIAARKSMYATDTKGLPLS